MRALVILLAVGITWTQVTPTDNKGCAGYSPTITDQQPTRVESFPSPTTDRSDRSLSENSTYGGTDYGGGHKIGDNRGHGQFDSNSDED